jgi:hypothetical protein
MQQSARIARWTGDILWLVALPLVVLMFVLATRVFATHASASATGTPASATGTPASATGTPGLARHDTGFAIATIAACLVVLCICWRGFEFLLWLRFPTAQQHTVAARIAAGVALVGLCVQVVVMLVK